MIRLLPLLAIAVATQIPDNRTQEQKDFIHAIQEGKGDVVRTMFKANPNLLGARLRDGGSSLQASAYWNQPAMTKLLLQLGAKPTLWDACSYGDEKIVRRELKLHPHWIDKQSQDGNTPLCLAVAMRHPDIARTLLRLGASYEARCSMNDNAGPMNSAVFGRDLECVKVLTEAGVDVNMEELDGSIPLHESANKGDLEIVKYLVEHGGDFRRVNKGGMTPLAFAKQSKHQAVVAYLESKGAK